MNKLSTQVVALLVLLVVTLVGVAIATDSDIDTDVKTADATLLELTAQDDAVDFTISYPNEWQAVPTGDGAGYIFTLKDPPGGISVDAQAQIQITLQGIRYADTLASAQSDLGADSLLDYETVDERRTGVRYANTSALDNGQQVVTEITILNPEDQSVTSEVEENRTVIAQLQADSNRIGDYRQILDLMLTTLKVAEPFSLPELAQTITNPGTGVTVNYPEGWTASVGEAPNDSIISIVPPNEADGLLRLAYLPLLDPSTGQLFTLADVESQIIGGVDPASFIQPMSLYSAGGFTGDAGLIAISSDTGQNYVYVIFLQLANEHALVALAEAGQNDIGDLIAVTDSVLQTLQFAAPVTAEPTSAPEESATEAPTEEATPAVEETPTGEATEAPTVAPTEAATEAPTEVPSEAATEVPTEIPTEEATPAN